MYISHLIMCSTLSIYVPRISTRFDHSMIEAQFKASFLVSVYRVDFVPIEGNTLFQSAFVYFAFDTSGYFSQCIFNKILDKDDAQESFRLDISNSEYWWLLPNRFPVPETTLNMHQMAENSRLLELRVSQLELLMMQQMNHISYMQSSRQTVDYDDMPALISVEDLNSDSDSDVLDRNINQEDMVAMQDLINEIYSATAVF